MLLFRRLRSMAWHQTSSSQTFRFHQGNAGKLGNYPILSVLPDKFARFLFEYHSHRFESLDLPLLPADRSDFDVHGALLDDKVQNKMSYPAVYYVLSNATLVLSIITIMTVIYIILDHRISRHIYAFVSYTLHCFLGIAVRTPCIGRLTCVRVLWVGVT